MDDSKKIEEIATKEENPQPDLTRQYLEQEFNTEEEEGQENGGQGQNNNSEGEDENMLIREQEHVVNSQIPNYEEASPERERPIKHSREVHSFELTKDRDSQLLPSSKE